MPRPKFGFLVSILALSSLGCFGSGGVEPANPPPGDSAPQFHARLLEIADAYSSYNRMDKIQRWANMLCRIGPEPPVVHTAPVPRFSESPDSATHGKKLYSLFVKNKPYTPEHGPSPVGQAVVKEAWVPVPVPEGEVDYLAVKGKDGKDHRAGQKAGLFIMYKLDPGTPGTDGGWVYGTVTAEGKVASAGRVGSCMRCHQGAPHDRLFGLAKD